MTATRNPVGGRLVAMAVAAALSLGPGCSRGTSPGIAGSRDSTHAERNDSVASSNHRRTQIQLADWTDRSGIDFVHVDGNCGRHYIMETVSCGLATFDYDGDGLIDIYFCNGASLPGCDPASKARHALYRNLGNLVFREVTDEAGLGCTAFGLGVTIGDYDNDGHPDIYLSNFGPNVLYRNNGDGTFATVTTEDTGRSGRVGAGTCFLDMDGDGDLDLFAANYVQFSTAVHHAPEHRGRSVYPGPLDYPAATNTLLRNQGDGRFTDVSADSGISAKPGTGMGVVAGDFDADGHADICVANDEMANFLYRGNGRGSFEETGILSGVAYDGLGMARGSMGVDCGDYDNDGWLDLYVTAYEHERATLYRNMGNGFFHDVTQLTGAGDGTSNNVTWGCCFGDLDHDGDRDLFIASGHLDDRNDNKVYRAANLVLENKLAETGTARFENVSSICGDGPRVIGSSRGAAMDDLDNDGDLDIVVLNSRERPTVIANQLQQRGSTRHWLQLRLCSVTANRDGVGARVRLTAGDLVLVDTVHSGRGYQSHFGSRLHFGLGGRTRVDRIEICWSGGGTEILRNVAVDQLLTIRETDAPPP